MNVVLMKGGVAVVTLALLGTGAATVSAYGMWSGERAELHEEAMALHQAGDHEAAQALMQSARGEMVGAYGDMAQKWQERYEERETRREVMDDIFENDDYDAFLAMHTERHQERLERLEERGIDTTDIEMPEITEEQFQVMQQVHSLRQNGDHEEARELAEKAGLPGKGSGPLGHQEGKGGNGKGQRGNK